MGGRRDAARVTAVYTAVCLGRPWSFAQTRLTRARAARKAKGEDMEVIRRACPQCHAMLELPASAMGRKARCPACQSTFRIGGEEPGRVEGEVSGPTAPTSPAVPEAGQSDPPTSGGHPVAPRAYPTASPANPYAVNPAMASAAAEAVPSGEIAIRKANIDDVVSASLAIFSRRWAPLIIAGLILFGFSFAIGIVSGGVNMLGDVNDWLSAEVLVLLSQIVIGFASYYLTIGMMTVALGVARGRDVTASQIFVSPAVFGRVLLPVLALVLFGAVSQAITMQVVGAAETFEEVFITMAFSAAGSLIISLLLLFIWPCFYVACDGRASNLAAVAMGFRIGVHNIATSLFLVVIALVLGVASLITCGLGVIITQPILLLLGAVAYLQMTSQPVSDPNQTQIAWGPEDLQSPYSAAPH